MLGSISVFWLLLILIQLIGSGGWPVIGPYAAEVWPSHLRATGMGSAYGFGGIGKVIGPAGLALILGSSQHGLRSLASHTSALVSRPGAERSRRLTHNWPLNVHQLGEHPRRPPHRAAHALQPIAHLPLRDRGSSRSSRSRALRFHRRLNRILQSAANMSSP
jgi:hypothetical protein